MVFAFGKPTCTTGVVGNLSPTLTAGTPRLIFTTHTDVTAKKFLLRCDVRSATSASSTASVTVNLSQSASHHRAESRAALRANDCDCTYTRAGDTVRIIIGSARHAGARAGATRWRCVPLPVPVRASKRTPEKDERAQIHTFTSSDPVIPSIMPCCLLKIEREFVTEQVQPYVIGGTPPARENRSPEPRARDVPRTSDEIVSHKRRRGSGTRTSA